MKKLTQISANIWLSSALFVLMLIIFTITLFNLPIELHFVATLKYHNQDYVYFSVLPSDALKIKKNNQVYLHLGTKNYLIYVKNIVFDQETNQFNIFFESLTSNLNQILENNITLEATIIYDLVKVQDLFF